MGYTQSYPKLVGIAEQKWRNPLHFFCILIFISFDKFRGEWYNPKCRRRICGKL